MKIVVSIFAIMFTILHAFSQDKMIVDKVGGFPFYEGYTKDIASFDQLPPQIKSNTQTLPPLLELSPTNSVGIMCKKSKIVNSSFIKIR